MPGPADRPLLCIIGAKSRDHCVVERGKFGGAELLVVLRFVE